MLQLFFNFLFNFCYIRKFSIYYYSRLFFEKFQKSDIFSLIKDSTVRQVIGNVLDSTVTQAVGNVLHCQENILDNEITNSPVAHSNEEMEIAAETCKTITQPINFKHIQESKNL